MISKNNLPSKMFCVVLIITIFLLSACDQIQISQNTEGEADIGVSNQGTSAWIEYPLEGWIIPNQPVVLVAYAGGAGGVMGIQLSINGQTLPSLGASDLSTEGTNQQVRLDYPWQPPAPGPYILSASAIGGSGASGAGTTVNFCVETCEEQAPATITPTPDADITPTPSPEITPTWTKEPPSKDIPETEPPDDEDQGEEIPDTEPPPDPPADTSGPSIDSGSMFFESCQFYGQASASDPSGVSWMKFGFNKNDAGWSWVWMSDYGGLWQSDAGISVEDGIGTPVGTIQYKFQAGDTLGNESTSGVYSYNYTSCDG